MLIKLNSQMISRTIVQSNKGSTVVISVNSKVVVLGIDKFPVKRR